MATETTETYRWNGPKNKSDGSARLRFGDQEAELGGNIELPADVAEELKQTQKLSKASDPDPDTEGDKSTEGEDTPEKGSEQTVATGAQAPAADTAKDKRPGAPGAGKTS